jgi:hypothetical protein
VRYLRLGLGTVALHVATNSDVGQSSSGATS